MIFEHNLGLKNTKTGFQKFIHFAKSDANFPFLRYLFWEKIETVVMGSPLCLALANPFMGFNETLP